MKTETLVGMFIVIAIGIFIYLSVNIGALRLDVARYSIYKTYFDDTGGLDVKAPVKIAGVDVGWVESIELMEDGKAEIRMRVSKNVRLAKNAYAVISQEGLIGTKMLELEPGDPSTGTLVPGSTLAMPGKSPATVGELLDQFKDIASSIQDIAYSVKNVFASSQGEADMKSALKGLSSAATKMSDFSVVLERTMRKNEENINSILSDFQKISHHLDTGIPDITRDFNETFPAAKRLAVNMTDETLPRVNTAFDSIDSTAVQAREAFKEAGQVVEKLNSGKGVLGKLINEDETYTDIKKTVRGLRDYIGKAQSMLIDVDMHSESVLARDWNSKGYMELKLRPSQDYFYQFQLVSDEKHGSVHYEDEFREWKDDKGHSLEVKSKNYGDDEYGRAQYEHDKLEFAPLEEKKIRIKNDIMFGFQFGKRFDRLALRVGMFENSFGVACDYYVPLRTNKVHWITSLEAFDFKGQKRIDDTRPYIRWVNKVFFLRNLYTAFGIEDAISKKTSGPFWGGGIRFGDDDLKYLLSMLPVGTMVNKK